MGLEVNANDSEYLDVFLTANAPGWVAVGFSETPNMVRLATCIAAPLVSVFNLRLLFAAKQ